MVGVGKLWGGRGSRPEFGGGRHACKWEDMETVAGGRGGGQFLADGLPIISQPLRLTSLATTVHLPGHRPPSLCVSRIGFCSFWVLPRAPAVTGCRSTTPSRVR